MIDVPNYVYEGEWDGSEDSGARDFARPAYRACSYFTDSPLGVIELMQHSDVLNPDGSTDGTDKVKYLAETVWKDFTLHRSYDPTYHVNSVKFREPYYHALFCVPVTE